MVNVEILRQTHGKTQWKTKGNLATTFSLFNFPTISAKLFQIFSPTFSPPSISILNQSFPLLHRPYYYNYINNKKG